MSIRFKRLIAFIIDWNIILFPFVLIFTLLTILLTQLTKITSLIVLALIPIIFLALGAFVFRDVIFKGRSLGKRIFDLYVYDQNTLAHASKRQCFMRNIFFFLYFFDGIILLATGKTIGDRVAATVVLTKADIDLRNNEIVEPKSAKNNVKKIILIIATIVICLATFIGLIMVALNSEKDTEEYKVAYNYFIESQTFKDLNVDESKIRFNQYSVSTHKSKDGNITTQTAKIGFMVNFKSFEVVCHKENGIWQVCDDCTVFK